jgi:hypothetical protein
MMMLVASLLSEDGIALDVPQQCIGGLEGFGGRGKPSSGFARPHHQLKPHLYLMQFFYPLFVCASLYPTSSLFDRMSLLNLLVSTMTRRFACFSYLTDSCLASLARIVCIGYGDRFFPFPSFQISYLTRLSSFVLFFSQRPYYVLIRWGKVFLSVFDTTRSVPLFYGDPSIMVCPHYYLY